MPEGTVFFADEPILRVTAPLPQAQLVETRLINILHFQSLVAAKAARMMLAAPGKLLVDFGLRRAHGARGRRCWPRARATSRASPAPPPCWPSKLFGIPIYGTMAHSFIQAHDDETAAFEDFARARPREPTLLIDTYDTEAAARKVVALAPQAQGRRDHDPRRAAGQRRSHRAIQERAAHPGRRRARGCEHLCQRRP